jgi:hypothetical protein
MRAGASGRFAFLAEDAGATQITGFDATPATDEIPGPTSVPPAERTRESAAR